MLDGTLRGLKLVQGIGNRLAPSLDRQTSQLPGPLPAGDDLGDHFARAPTKAPTHHVNVLEAVTRRNFWDSEPDCFKNRATTRHGADASLW